MRRVRRSVWSKLDITNTAHPLSQFTLPPCAPGRLLAFAGGTSLRTERRGIFLPFSPGGSGKV